MRPGSRYDRMSYRDSRPGRHATRAAAERDAITEYALAITEHNDIGGSDTPVGVLDLCTCLGDGGCFGCDPDYLDKCAAARDAAQSDDPHGGPA